MLLSVLPREELLSHEENHSSLTSRQLRGCCAHCIPYFLACRYSPHDSWSVVCLSHHEHHRNLKPPFSSHLQSSRSQIECLRALPVAHPLQREKGTYPSRAKSQTRQGRWGRADASYCTIISAYADCQGSNTWPTNAEHTWYSCPATRLRSRDNKDQHT